MSNAEVNGVKNVLSEIGGDGHIKTNLTEVFLLWVWPAELIAICVRICAL